MPVTWLKSWALKRFIGSALSASALCLCGCYNMNGYMLNASGMNLYERGNYALAAQDFQTAVANNPQNPDYVSNLAKARMKLGDAAGAEQLFRQALTTNPGHQPSYHGLAELMLAQGRGPEAGQMLQTWAATQPYVAESHVELAWLQRELGQHQQAAQSLQQALQANPNHPTALAHLGQYYQDQGQPQQAVAMYQRSLQADWDQPHVHNRLASVAQSAGPNHPMGQIAMARGVHPQSIPRQQLAFGPTPVGPPTGAPAPMMAGSNPMMAASGSGNFPPPSSAPWGMPSGSMQAGPMPSPEMVAQQSMMPPTGQLPAPMEWTPTTPDGSYIEPSSPYDPAMSQNSPAQVAGIPGMMPGMMGLPMMSQGSSLPTAEASFSAAPSGPIQIPQPDPAFQMGSEPASSPSSVPVSGISQSRVVEDDLIELEAF